MNVSQTIVIHFFASILSDLLDSTYHKMCLGVSSVDMSRKINIPDQFPLGLDVLYHKEIVFQKSFQAFLV